MIRLPQGASPGALALQDTVHALQTGIPSMTPPTTTLTVRRVVGAPPERVWAVLSDPAMMGRWLNGAEFGVSRFEADVVVGGTFHGHMIEGDRTFLPNGRYLEVVPPSRLRFSWRLPELVETSEVDIQLIDLRGEGTEVVLTHRLPESEQLLRMHRNGWSWCLARLAVHSELGTAGIPNPPEFIGGENIALKVPPHRHAETVAFYRDVLRLKIVHLQDESVAFRFNSKMTLWVDKVASQTNTDVWLELQTSDTVGAADYLRRLRTTRRDEVEALPDNFDGFWIAEPGGVIHLVRAAAPPESPRD